MFLKLIIFYWLFSWRLTADSVTRLIRIKKKKEQGFSFFLSFCFLWGIGGYLLSFFCPCQVIAVFFFFFTFDFLYFPQIYCLASFQLFFSSPFFALSSMSTSDPLVSKSDDRHNKKIHAIDGSVPPIRYENRKCTDVLFLILFLAFWVHLSFLFRFFFVFSFSCFPPVSFFLNILFLILHLSQNFFFFREECLL